MGSLGLFECTEIGIGPFVTVGWQDSELLSQIDGEPGFAMPGETAVIAFKITGGGEARDAHADAYIWLKDEPVETVVSRACETDDVDVGIHIGSAGAFDFLISELALEAEIRQLVTEQSAEREAGIEAYSYVTGLIVGVELRRDVSPRYRSHLAYLRTSAWLEQH